MALPTDWKDRIQKQEGITTLALGPQAYVETRDPRYVSDAYQYYLQGMGGGPDAATIPATTVAQAPTAPITTGGDQGLAVAPGITGTSAAQNMGGGAQNPLTQIPVGQTQTVKQLMTSPAAYNIPGQMPKTPVSGAWGPQSYLQDQGPRVTLPSGDVLAADDPLLDEKTDYMGKPKSFWDNVKQRAAAGADIASEFGQSIADGLQKLVNMSPTAMLLNAIEPASGRQQKAVKDQLVDSGVVLDDIGRIVQTGDYNTPQNVMAGYTPGQTGLQIGGLKIGGGTVQHSAAERINDIQNTIDNLDENWSQLKASDPEAFEAKKQNLIDRQEALKEFINMGAAEAAGGVRLEDWDPENKIAGEVVYGTDHFPELGQEDTAPIDDIDEGFQTRFTAKDEGAWKGPGEISGVAGKTIVDPDTYMGSTVEGGLGLRGTIDRTEPTVPVTGVEGPPSITSPEIYQDPIMDIADERRALQEELEAYRDPIRDMVDPTGEINVEDLTKEFNKVEWTEIDNISKSKTEDKSQAIIQ